MLQICKEKDNRKKNKVQIERKIKKKLFRQPFSQKKEIANLRHAF